jgi:hypothetical protein
MPLFGVALIHFNAVKQLLVYEERETEMTYGMVTMKVLNLCVLYEAQKNYC